MSDTGQRMFDESVRMERCIWVTGAIADLESPSPDFKEFCEELPDAEDNLLYEQVPLLKQFANTQAYPEYWEVAEALLLGGVGGFIVKAASPVRRYLSETSHTASWGHYRTCWLHAQTIEEAAEACLRWAEEMGAKDLAASPLFKGAGQ